MTPNKRVEKFRSRVVAEYRASGMSGYTLQTKHGVNHNTMKQFENGGGITLATAIKLSKVFKIEI